VGAGGDASRVAGVGIAVAAGSACATRVEGGCGYVSEGERITFQVGIAVAAGSACATRVEGGCGYVSEGERITFQVGSIRNSSN
jgi:hypothetical protein